MYEKLPFGSNINASIKIGVGVVKVLVHILKGTEDRNC